MLCSIPVPWGRGKRKRKRKKRNTSIELSFLLCCCQKRQCNLSPLEVQGPSDGALLTSCWHEPHELQCKPELACLIQEIVQSSEVSVACSGCFLKPQPVLLIVCFAQHFGPFGHSLFMSNIPIIVRLVLRSCYVCSGSGLRSVGMGFLKKTGCWGECTKMLATLPVGNNTTGEYLSFPRTAPVEKRHSFFFNCMFLYGVFCLKCATRCGRFRWLCTLTQQRLMKERYQ